MKFTVISKVWRNKHEVSSKITCNRIQTNRAMGWTSASFVNYRNDHEFHVDIGNAGENNTNHHYVEDNANPNLVRNSSSINKEMESKLSGELTDLKLKGTSDGNQLLIFFFRPRDDDPKRLNQPRHRQVNSLVFRMRHWRSTRCYIHLLYNKNISQQKKNNFIQSYVFR